MRPLVQVPASSLASPMEPGGSDGSISRCDDARHAPAGVRVFYLRGARGLVAFYLRRPPDVLTREEILHYAEHLRQRGLAPTSRGVHHAAIRFLYRVTLRRPEVVEGLANPKPSKRKARVLKGSDIYRLWHGIVDTKHRAIFCVIYGCGLRVSEACGLLTADIDSARGRLLVRDVGAPKNAMCRSARWCWRSCGLTTPNDDRLPLTSFPVKERSARS